MFIGVVKDEEFHPIELLATSNYKFSDNLIDTKSANESVVKIVNVLRKKKEELYSLENKLRI